MELSSHPRQKHWLTIDSGYEKSALIIVLPKKSVRKFSDEFSKYVLPQDEFSKCIFHLGPVFIEPNLQKAWSTLKLKELPAFVRVADLKVISLTTGIGTHDSCVVLQPLEEIVVRMR